MQGWMTELKFISILKLNGHQESCRKTNRVSQLSLVFSFTLAKMKTCVCHCVYTDKVYMSMCCRQNHSDSFFDDQS